MTPHQNHRREYRELACWLGILLLGLLLVLALPEPDAARGLASYLPLHTALEVLSIAVAAMVFSIAWVTQKYRANGRALVLGVGLLGVALLDLSHALSYLGMPDFITPSSAEKAINFWLAARAMAAAALLWVAFWPGGWSGGLAWRWRFLSLLCVGLVVAGVHYLLLWHPEVIPRTFVPGSGLTALKIQLEYGLMVAYIVAGLGFWFWGARDLGRLYLALASIILAIGEYFFTLYVDVSDVYNLAGHLYKVIAYGFLYRGLFVETVRQPYLGLEMAEANQRATLETLPDLLFEMDRQGVCLQVHANDPSQMLATHQQFQGKSVTEVLPAEAAATCLAALKTAETQGVARGLRIGLALPDGLHYFELALARKAAPAGRMPTYVALSRDVTAAVLNEQRLMAKSLLSAALLDLQHHDGHEQESDFLRRGLAHAQRLSESPVVLLLFAKPDGQGVDLADGLVPQGLEPADYMAELPWPEVLRQRRAVVSAPQGVQAGQGLQGSACLPVVDGGQVRMLLGVGNKSGGYGDQDVQTLQVLADTIWQRTTQRRQDAVIHRLSEALDQSPSPVMMTDTQARILYVNRAFSLVSGYRAEEVLGRNPRLLQSGKTPRATYDDMWSRLPKGQAWQGELINRRKNGQVYTESASLYPIRDVFGQVTHYVAHKEDISLRRESEARIRALSNFDALTGLSNKKSFEGLLAEAMERGMAQHERVSLLWFNLDQFKLINESLGHAAGDELLVEQANRLRRQLGAHIALGRYSSDVFVAIVPRKNQAAVALMVQEALAVLQTPVHIDGHALTVSASVGVAVFPDDAKTPGALASSAEVAMYRAKQDGGNTLRFFAPEMQAHTHRSLALASGLQQAAARGEFFLVFQPQCALGTGVLTGAEALLRWNHPEWGLVSPAEFIPIAEQSGAIVPIDLWVLEQAARQLRAWDAQGIPQLVVSVNVSAAQFGRPQFVEAVQATLQRVGVAPQRIEMELTEAVALKQPEQAEITIRKLHAVGIRVALDDFGTGYSSMSYLKRYALDKLKIDQSFVRDLVDEDSDRAIVTAIIRMAQSLGLRTIAEGVETAGQAALLHAYGCDEMQGYWYSRPLDPRVFAEFAQRHRQPMEVSLA
jgi:diguanylate cyclase (GGDEF)-like protein/PAS domain S-box-containing protein